MGLPCHICGRPIHYDEPSDAQHPLSFVVDEIRPISKYKMFGYSSREEAAQDWDNLAPAHWICNQIKSNKVTVPGQSGTKEKVFISDGEW